MTRQPLESTRFVNPPDLAPPPGYSNVVEVSNSRIIFIAGQTATDPEGKLVAKAISKPKPIRFSAILHRHSRRSAATRPTW